MKHSALSSLSVLSLLIGTLTLVGCGAALSSSNSGSSSSTPPTAGQAHAGPAINGFVYGGHSPIQGSHVYLLQPGTSGYGSLATSLLGNNGATSANGYAITVNPGDPNVPAGAKYVLTDSQGAFSLTNGYNCTPGLPVYIYADGGNIGGGALNNKSIVELATLGNCPNNGSTATDNFYSGSSALSYIYLNEVSTVATAYTFQPFTLVTNNDAWHIGTSNTTQGILGIANAASTAAQLYSIQGGQDISGTNGEGHVANYQTLSGTTPNGGNGVVPEATIDSLANILANCVDSTVANITTTTATCTSLFNIATNDGTTATAGRPVDTATAAINIARFPAGNNSGTANPNYVTGLYALQAGTPATPYQPQLNAAPHDWTLAILYPVNTPDNGNYSASNPTLGQAESVAVDNFGQIWLTAQTSTSIARYTPLGVQQLNRNLGYIAGYVSIDGGNNAWVGNAASTSSIREYDSNGTASGTYGSGYQQAYTMVTNGAGDAFFFAKTTATGTNYAMFEYGPGGATITGSPFTIGGSADTTTEAITISNATVVNRGGGNYTYTFTYAPSGPFPIALAAGNTVTLALVDGAAGILGAAATGWENLTSVTILATPNGTTFTANGTVRTTNSTGLLGGGNTTGTGSATVASTSGVPAGNNVAHGAINHDGNIWITSEGGNSIGLISPTGIPIFNSFFTTQQPEFPAIDHGGNAWIPVQETASQIYVVSPTGTPTILTSASTGAALSSSFGSAVDGNGNVWIANRCSNYGGACTNTNGEASIVLINGGAGTPGAAQNAISPPTNYIPEAQYPNAGNTTTYPLATGQPVAILQDPLNLAIDPSGNVWVTNYKYGGVVELVGAAAPVATPLSVAAAANQLGQKP